MAGSWNANINFIQDGERVDANVSGRPDRALSDRTSYLKDRIDAIDNGQALFAFDVAVESSVLVGQAVYWNATSQQFEKALASVVIDAEGSLVNSAESEVVGVVFSKTSSTVATLLISGKAALDISNAIVGSVQVGRYFLSANTVGQLERQAEGASIPVLYADGNGIVFVQPQYKNIAENHCHFKFDLYTTVAGVHGIPAPGQRHAITSPDASKPGWLPADHASFQDLAPKGAAFGYNLAQHSDLNRVWPPMPAEYAAVVLFSGDKGLGQELPMGETGLVVIDRHGLWWMSDCYGDVPWDINYTTSFSSSEVSQGDTPECPRDLTRKLVLYFAKVRYGGKATVVTSLRTDSPTSPLVVTDLDDNPSNVGDLKIKFDGGLMIANDTAQGSLVLKELSSNQFRRGRVVEGIKSANNSVTITSTASRLDGGVTLHQGVVSIEANLDGVERLIIPQVVRLIDVRERYENDIMYLGFPSGIQTSVRYKFKLPGADGFPASGQVKLRLWVTGDASTAALPKFDVSYRRLPRATTAAAIPVTDTNLDWDAASLTSGTFGTITTDQYLEVDTETFSVDESDVVLFTVTRNLGGDDGYAGEIGILDAVAVLSPGA